MNKNTIYIAVSIFSAFILLILVDLVFLNKKDKKNKEVIAPIIYKDLSAPKKIIKKSGPKPQDIAARALASSSPEKRIYGLQLMTGGRFRGYSQSLLGALRDPSKKVVLFAIGLCARHPEVYSAPYLIGFLSESGSGHAAAEKALIQLSAKQPVLNFLPPLARVKDLGTQMSAMKILEKNYKGKPAENEVLRSFLLSAYPKIQSRVLVLLGKADDAAIARVSYELNQLLQSKDPKVQRRAGFLLKRLKNR